MSSRARAIIVDNVSKAFSPQGYSGSLRSALGRLLKQAKTEPFWALQDVSFEVGGGEVFGIIGHNGSGKSTMLKLLAGIMRPTTGTVRLAGRVAPLIEVGAGFHPELTGRENIFLNGAIMGLTRKTLERRFDDIVEFSGLAPFLDRPVKHYSSGMYMRLGFSIAVHVDPDVLLVDEVLAVGDQAFQQACLAKVKSMRDQGVAVVLVSHNLFAVTSMCQRVLLLKQGRPLCLASSAEAVLAYEADIRTSAGGPAGADTVDAERDVVIKQLSLLSSSASSSHGAVLASGTDLQIDIEVVSKIRIEAPVWVFGITRSDGTVCGASNSRLVGQPCPTLEGSSRLLLCLPRLNLVPGAYSIDVSISDSDLSVEYHRATLWFEVTSQRPNLDPTYYGILLFDHHWNFSP